jgi:hypothetical protein
MEEKKEVVLKEDNSLIPVASELNPVSIESS